MLPFVVPFYTGKIQVIVGVGKSAFRNLRGVKLF
jgi:hypothetical protein